MIARGELDPSRFRPHVDAAPEPVTPPPEVGVYTVKNRMSHPQYRMNERTEFHPSNIDKLQSLVDMMGLSPGSYHLPLRDRAGNVGGYAVFKGVHGRKTPALSTVYSKDMRPPGSDIEAMLKSPPQLEFKA